MGEIDAGSGGDPQMMMAYFRDHGKPEGHKQAQDRISSVDSGAG